MSDTTEQKDILRGGQFLVKETSCDDVFTPEDFNEEQKMMRDSVKEFVDREIVPHKERFEKKRLRTYGRNYAKSRGTWFSWCCRTRRI